MAQTVGQGELLRCSFCSKSHREVGQLVAGPNVYICDDCINSCSQIIQKERAGGTEGGVGRGKVR